MGLTLRDVIFGIGGGIKKDKKFKAVQMGGRIGRLYTGRTYRYTGDI